MYSINKQQAPNALTEYKRQDDATYDNLPKDVRCATKKSLLDEQGHVCAYCMARIKFDAMRLEHWACQDDNPDLQLDYNNMLACCKGNEGQPKETYTCDKKKSNMVLRYSPAKPEHNINSRVYYANGKIKSREVDFEQQLELVLNLNESRLLENRRAALEAIHEKLDSRQGTRTKRQVRALHSEVLALNTKNKHKPYYGFLAQYLQSKL